VILNLKRNYTNFEKLGSSQSNTNFEKQYKLKITIEAPKCTSLKAYTSKNIE
jgi:hypothetical protein